MASSFAVFSCAARAFARRSSNVGSSSSSGFLPQPGNVDPFASSFGFFPKNDVMVACFFGFEKSAIVFFFVLSEWLQRWCVHHTAAQTKGLGGMLPETVSPADGSADKPLAEVLVGEAVLVKPGQAVPTDGVVLDGRSAVDESMLTGESMPVQKAQGASVFAGTTNQGGVLTVRVMRLPSESAAAQLTTMVATAQRAGSKELFLERFAKV